MGKFIFFRTSLDEMTPMVYVTQPHYSSLLSIKNTYDYAKHSYYFFAVV